MLLHVVIEIKLRALFVRIQNGHAFHGDPLLPPVSHAADINTTSQKLPSPRSPYCYGSLPCPPPAGRSLQRRSPSPECCARGPRETPVHPCVSGLRWTAPTLPADLRGRDRRRQCSTATPDRTGAIRNSGRYPARRDNRRRQYHRAGRHRSTKVVSPVGNCSPG